MKVNSVSSFGLQKPVSYMGTEDDVKAESPKTFSKIEKSDLTKYLVGSLVCIGAVTAGIFALRRGKIKKPVEISPEEFNNAGNILTNGMALHPDLSGYTGVLTTINKSGNKYNLEYVNGILSRVSKNEKDANGKYILSEIKTYNYDDNGNIISITKKNPQVEGEEEIVDILKLKEKALKQMEIRQSVNSIRTQLSGKNRVSSATIDESFNDYKRISDVDPGYRALYSQFAKQEQKERNIKANIEQIKANYKPEKPEISADIIDRSFPGKNPEIDELNNYYEDLENLSNERFSGKNSKNIATLSNNKISSKRSVKFINDPTLGKIKQVVIKNKDGSETSQIISLDDMKLLKEVKTFKNSVITTTFNNDVKYVTSRTENLENDIVTNKIFVKDKNGKYVCIHRTYTSDNMAKTVDKLDDGGSKTVIKTPDKIETIIRDKKGNIISSNIETPDSSGKFKPGDSKSSDFKNPVELKASWYIEYQRLCKKYNVSEGFSKWNHYYELCMRENDPRAYYKYMNLQKYRASYDPEAVLSLIRNAGIMDSRLRNDVIKQCLEDNDIYTLCEILSPLKGSEVVEEAYRTNNFDKIINWAKEYLPAQRTRTNVVHKPRVVNTPVRVYA